MLATVRELGIGFVAYSPLGRGFLTGSIRTPADLAPDDFRRGNPRFQGENFRKNLELVASEEEIARERGCTPGQIALAWVRARGEDAVPIPGTKHVKTSRRTRRPRTWSSPPPTSRGWTPCSRWERPRARGTGT